MPVQKSTDKQNNKKTNLNLFNYFYIITKIIFTDCQKNVLNIKIMSVEHVCSSCL